MLSASASCPPIDPRARARDERFVPPRGADRERRRHGRRDRESSPVEAAPPELALVGIDTTSRAMARAGGVGSARGAGTHDRRGDRLVTPADAPGPPPAPRTLDALRSGRLRGVAPVVVALGVVSFFTDVSTEMVAAALPSWLLDEHGFQALALGAIEGVWRGGAAVAGLVAALAADRWRRRKLAAFAGYGISAACKPLLVLAAGSWPAVLVVLAADRVGKGVRTAPRDALISLASAAHVRARAFAVHRTFDTLGMLLGPFAAFAILALAPGRFDAVVVASTGAALIGLATLWAFVDEPAEAREGDATGGSDVGSLDASRSDERATNRDGSRPSERANVRDARARPDASKDEGARSPLRELFAHRRLRRLVVVAVVLGCVGVGEMQIAVVLERGGALASASLPLFFAGIACAQLALIHPAARLADRFGRARTFVGAHVLLLAALAGAASLADRTWGPFVAVVLLGGFLAATEGVLAAAASLAAPQRSRTAAIALAGGAFGGARLLASLAFGAAWAAVGSTAALVVFSSALFLALAASAMLVRDGDATALD